MPPEPGRRDLLIGIFLIVVSSAMFCGVDGISKLLSDSQSVAQIIWSRYVLALPVLLAVTGPKNWSGMFRTRMPFMQIARGATPLVISVCMVLGVRYMPLAEATVILFASPFLVVALSAPLLKERVSPASWIAVAIGFLAVLIVARPGFGAFSTYAIFPFVGAVFFALLQLITRRLGAAGERPQTTLAWTLLVGAIVVTPIAIFHWEPVSPSAWVLMLSLGTVFGVAQLLMARGFTYAPASVLTPFTYSQIAAAVIFGAIVFGDIPDAWTFVGIAMIVAAGVYVVRAR